MARRPASKVENVSPDKREEKRFEIGQIVVGQQGLDEQTCKHPVSCAQKKINSNGPIWAIGAIMRDDDDKLLNAIYSMNGKLERIENALWFLSALLVAIFLTLAFPGWRGIFG